MLPHALSGRSPATASVWKERKLRDFLLAALASNIGNWVQIFSEQWLVFLLVGSLASRWAGRLGFASGFAVLVFIPLGGSLADRLDRRKALASAQIFLMLLALSMCALAALHQLTLPRLLAFAMASGVGAALSMPMGQSLMGDLVPPEKIPAVIGITPFGTLLAGEAAQRLGLQGPRLVILADGLILLASAAWLALGLKRGGGPKPITPSARSHPSL